MSIEVKVPQLPESVTDATVMTWHKRAGDSVRRDENLVDLETDKVVLEVPAPSDGVIKELKIADGAIVTGGQVLALLEPGEVVADEAPETAEPQAASSGPEPAAASAPVERCRASRPTPALIPAAIQRVALRPIASKSTKVESMTPPTAPRALSP